MPRTTTNCPQRGATRIGPRPAAGMWRRRKEISPEERATHAPDIDGAVEADYYADDVESCNHNPTPYLQSIH